MVCENRRLRSLLVSRRGGFLEDPFFRDAWGDYNNAVRRIVDRFNHGMFTPSDRLRDSHYHSIYRTLRSARINYAAQAARFKDEGDHYKLVMDVREFVGGEITVRTAGGTLSVRGRLETGVGDDGDSTYSGISRDSSSSARTLHRRFTLPPDADGEKVQSTLSRDAVLTVTIGKRSDVRVIPVTVEGETPPPSASGRSGIKRHSAAQPEPGPTPSKRSQDNHHEQERGSQDLFDRRDRGRSTSRNRGEAFGMGRNKQDEKENSYDWKTRREEETTRDSDRMNRRGSEIFTRRDGVRDVDDTRRRSYPTNSTRQTAEEISKKYLGRRSQEYESRRRARDTVEEEAEADQRTRKRASKYEEAKEFHIPIRFEGSNDANIVFQYPGNSKENVISSDEQGATGGKDADQSESPKSARYSKNTESMPYSSSLINKAEREKQNGSVKPEKLKTFEKDTSNLNNNLMDEKENIRPSKDEASWVYSKLYDQNGSLKENSATEDSNKSKESTATDEKKRYYFGGMPLSNNKNENVGIKVTSPTSNTSATRNGKSVDQRKEEEPNSKTINNERKEVNDEALSSVKDDSKIQKDYLRTESQESESPGRKSPLEGREVVVEKKQSDMEGDMFKDCWQNFSSTLQEVLSRLQELSSELGPPKSQMSSSLPTKSNEREDSSQDMSTDHSSSWINNKVPKGDAANGEISEEGVPVTIGGNAWASSAGAEMGVGGEEEVEEEEDEEDEEEGEEEEESEGGGGGGGGTSSSPTTPPTVYAGLGSPTRSSHKDRETPRHMETSSTSSSSSSASISSTADTKRDYGQQRSRYPECHNDQNGQYPPKQQVSGQNVVVAESETGVPRRRSSTYSDSEGNSGVHHGGARAKGPPIANTATTLAGRPASICDPVRHSVPMSFIHDGSIADAFGKQVSNIHKSDTLLDASYSPVPRPRPTSLNLAHEGSLLKDLRKSSPVDALKDHFLSRATPSSELSSCDTDVHYIPVELEASKRVTLTGNSKREEKPLSPIASTTSPRTPATTLPLCERRGKGVENLVIVEDDDRSSNVSSHVSTASGTYGDDNTGDLAISESSSNQWPGHDKTASGNSRILSSTGYESFQHPSPQHSHSSKGGAESRTPTHIDNIGSRGAKGGSAATKSSRCPLQPSSSLSESEPDVDEIISQAERVIEETRRLSASITNELPVENDLDREKYAKYTREKAKDNLKLSGFNLAPNIDTRTSPESNFVELQDEEEKEEESEEDDDENERGKGNTNRKEDSVVEGCLTIPLPGLAGRPQQPRYTPPVDLRHTTHPPPPRRPTSIGEGKTAHRDSNSSLTIEAVEDSDDVIECEEVRPTIVTSPEIQSSDVMGCARGRRDGGGVDGGVFVPPSPRDMPLPPPPHTLSHEAQPTRASRHAAAAAAAAATARDSSMGGAFSRSRTHDSAARHPPTSNVTQTSTAKTKAAPTTPQSPATTPKLRERSISKEEAPLPPYVRQKPEPTKRYSGFGHVQSDNVRKMRDVWGSRQEPTATTPTAPTRPSRLPASPPPVPRRREAQSPRRAAPDSPKRFSDTPKFDPHNYRTESPSRGPESPRRVPDYTTRRGSDSSRRGPDSPRRGPDSPKRGPDSPKRGPDSPKRSFFSRDSPSRDSGRSVKNNNTNFYSSTISSRNKTSSSPRRGSTSSTEGGAAGTPFAQPSVSRSSAAGGGAANSASPVHDKYKTGSGGSRGGGAVGGGGGGWAGSPVSSRRNSRRASTPPPPTPPSTAAPPPRTGTAASSAGPPPASPFHHKVFKKLRDSSLQPDSETICFKEAEDMYKLVMDVEEYVPGEIEVLQDDKMLTVKGRVETKQGGNTTTRTFHRKFHIPHNSREEDIDSALSKDGILTVYVPKKRERVIKIELTD